MQKPSVIIVENSRDTTGAFNAIFYFAEYAHGDFDFVFVLPKGSKLVDKVKNAGFAVEELPYLEIGKSLKKLLLYLPYLLYNGLRFVRLCKKYQARLVHINDFYNLVGVMGKLLGGKYHLLTHIRFMPNRFPELLLKLWYGLGIKFSKNIICVSHAVKNCLPEHPKLTVIYDTIPTSETNTIINNVHKDERVIRLLYLAHYIPGKGQDHSLEAFHLSYKQDKRLRLRFVGGDMNLQKNKKFKTDLIERAKALQIADVVEFSGPTDNVKKEFEQCDIALNFSESESFSFTALEALSYGVPLIATDSGGPAELFENGKSGLLIPVGDINKMYKAILKLSSQTDLMKKFKINGPDFVSNKFSKEKTVNQLCKVYYASLIL